MELITANELAKILKMDKQTVYRKANSGEIPCLRIGSGKKKIFRFDKQTVATWMLSQTNIQETKV